MQAAAEAPRYRSRSRIRSERQTAQPRHPYVNGSGIPVGSLVNDRLIAFHVARARGGVALTIDPGQTPGVPVFIDNTRPEVVDGMPGSARRCTPGAPGLQQVMRRPGERIPGRLAPGASAIPDPGLRMVAVR